MTTLTHRRHTNALPAEYAKLMAYEGNEHYGDFAWTINPASLVEIPAALIAYCANYYGIDADAALALLDPASIVDSAGAWDDPDFVTSWCDIRSDWDVAGYHTQDGAVVLDASALIAL